MYLIVKHSWAFNLQRDFKEMSYIFYLRIFVPLLIDYIMFYGYLWILKVQPFVIQSADLVTET